MHKTAWTPNLKGSSLPSDRIPQKGKGKLQGQVASQPQQTQGKGKGKQRDALKSKEVLELEKLRDDLRNANGEERDPKCGCFCQARMHALSTYTPICRACGLILCTLNLPHYACPHCSTHLLLPAARTALLATLDTQIHTALAQEEEARARAAQEARAAQGAFPTLSSAAATSSSAESSRTGTPGPDAQARPATQTHKVMSLTLNPKSKARGKVKVASYAPPGTAAAAAAEAALRVKREAQGAKEPEYKRVPAPPAEVVVARAPLDARRPWANLRGLNVTYVPPAGA